MSYQVTAPVVTVLTQVERGRARVDRYQGAVLPDDVPAEDIDRLLLAGHVVEVDEPAPEPVEQAEPEPEKPDGRASEAAWRAYAVAQGMPQDEADSLSKDDLRDRFR